MVLSLGSMAGMVAMLVRIQDTATDQWTFFWSPNTFISVFATITKTTLLLPLAECLSQLKWVYFSQKNHSLYDFERFDEASRGPWGALKFVFLVRWRSIMGLVAALLVLLALFLGPFFQQVLMLRYKSIEVRDVAVFSVAKDYDTGGQYRSELSRMGMFFPSPK